MAKVSRRDVLRMGAALAGGAALSTMQPGIRTALAQDSGSSRPPDIVVIITDQERHHVHLPDGFIERTAPSWTRLAEQGLTYRQAFTASAMCSP